MPNNSETITHPLLAPEIQGVAEVLVELGASCHPFPRVEKGILEECTSAIIFYSMETPKAAKFPVWSAPPVALGTEANEIWLLTPNAAHWPTRHPVLEGLWMASSPAITRLASTTCGLFGDLVSTCGMTGGYTRWD